ncbi:unnamed protein product [Linum tenue]|uniref:DNA-3-methyladenine glycosylase I n=1 Tax=Linum tenue TaxID=586396 RepID=A0AAV0IE07_9ROSI|nr:unnamed protein product [Linum tenue]
MSGGAPRVRSMNVADSDQTRPVFGPTGNNKSGALNARKPKPLPLSKVEKSPEEKKPTTAMYNSSSRSPKSHSLSAASLLRRHEQLLHSNLSMNASCSSDASTDSFHSRASTGRLVRSYSAGSRRKAVSKPRSVASDSGLESPTSPGGSQFNKKTCAWVTPNTDPCYAAFHDEEWGVPVHNDKKLFELLVLSGALAELTWPTILSKRHIFRFKEVFADFDPISVSKFNEKKFMATSWQVIEEFGSFDKYIWSFVNDKPISVGPTIVYSFMQSAGITNDHLIGCFRFQECVNVAEGKEENGTIKAAAEECEQEQGGRGKTNGEIIGSEISITIDDLSLEA